MNDTETSKNVANTDMHVKELEEENELLLLQLHQVQEELEQQSLRSTELEKKAATRSIVGGTELHWVDDKLPNALAELERLKALYSMQAKVHKIEMENSLTTRLGSILIDSVDNDGVLSVPGRLVRMWRQSKKKTPPRLLGGGSFWKVISTYNVGGFEAVEKLLTQAAVFPSVRGNAYTVLARHLQKLDAEGAANAAYRAYVEDPRLYRLKWLAYRFHDAGKIQEAEAILTILPRDVNLSESEERQIGQIRYDAKTERLQKAYKVTDFHARRTEIEQRLDRAEAKAAEYEELAKDTQIYIDKLEKANRRLECEKKSLFEERNELKRSHEEQSLRATEWEMKVSDLLRNRERVQQDKREHINQVVQKNQILTEHIKNLQGQLNELAKNDGKKKQHIDQLETQRDQLVEDRAGLRQQYYEQIKTNSFQQAQIERLIKDCDVLKSENAELIGRNEEYMKLAAEGKAMCDHVLQSKKVLAAKVVELQTRYDEREKSVRDMKVQIEELRKSRDVQSKEKVVLQMQVDDRLRCEAAQQRQVEQLSTEKKKLIEEKTILASELEELKKLVPRKSDQLSDLAHQLQHTESNKSEIVSRQQIIQDELVRAESQLELIKDLFRTES